MTNCSITPFLLFPQDQKIIRFGPVIFVLLINVFNLCCCNLKPGSQLTPASLQLITDISNLKFWDNFISRIGSPSF